MTWRSAVPRTPFPARRTFAFTVFDDTDLSTISNTRPVYELLRECGMRTTKSVWVLPGRGTFGGGTLSDADYLAFVRELASAGFEIGSHGVGDGTYSRDEIRAGMAAFEALLGSPPRVHTNHVSNPDNLYWQEERFEFPLRQAYAAWRRLRGRPLGRNGGHNPASPHHWGDIAAQKVRYVRNLTFNGVDTLAADPAMPYHVDNKPLVHAWFSSTDGHTVEEFRDLLRPERIDALEASGGACIVYTHFAEGFVDARGRVDPGFEQGIRGLAKRPGWFVPVGTLLDHLAINNGGTEDPGRLYHLRLNARWVVDRLTKQARYGR